MNVQQIRSNPRSRNDFLETLMRENRNTVVLIASRISWGRLSRDILRGECVQAFLVAANRAIDSYCDKEDGRGKSSLAGWCRYKGIRGVHDFVRIELGLKSPAKADFIRQLMLVPQIPDKSFSPNHYEELVISHLEIERFISSLSGIEKEIVSLLVFGHDTTGRPIRVGDRSRYGKPEQRTVINDHLAKTTGVSYGAIAKHLSSLRKKLA